MSNYSNNSVSLRHKAADWAVDWGIPIGAWVVPPLIGAACFGVTDEVVGFLSGFFGGSEVAWRRAAWILLFVGAGIWIPTALVSTWRTRKVSTLEARVRDLEEALDGVASDAIKVFDRQLRTLAEELEFGKFGNTERITLYVPGGQNFFTALSRFSLNPSYRAKKRKIYEEDAGAIGSTWRDKRYFRQDYPDPKDVEAWVARCRKDRMKDETARAINMKSQLYCGYRVDSVDHDFLGLVILESTSKNRYNEVEILNFLETRGEELLRPHLEQFSLSLPRATAAREAGL